MLASEFSLDSVEDYSLHLRRSLLEFTKYFYYLRTGKKFYISKPFSREPHAVLIARALTKVFLGQTKNLYIGIPPRYGKTELIIHFIAWSFANDPSCKFIVASYAKHLAEQISMPVREILMMREFRDLFGSSVSDSNAKRDSFLTTQNGEMHAVGTSGTITGFGAGELHAGKFKGALIIDDAIKPDEALSDTVRESVNFWYDNTFVSRKNDPLNTPIIVIGQRTHESDLYNKLITEYGFDSVIIPALDSSGNALDETRHSRAALEELRERNKYVFYSQYQQDPIAAGSSLFDRDYFVVLDREPDYLFTFITADTAETEKTYNDQTVFSFWGAYYAEIGGRKTDILCLNWIDCEADWIDAGKLEERFLAFFSSCLRHKNRPNIALIENKSTGTTLCATLRRQQGLKVIPVQRSVQAGSKSDRFLRMVEHVSAHKISFVDGAKHYEMCVKQMTSITANNSHRFDDIADTLFDAVDCTMINRLLTNMILRSDHRNEKEAISVVAAANSRFSNIHSIYR